MNDWPIKLDGMVPDRLRPKSGRIIVDSLEVMADIGFHDFERGNPQRLHISIELWVDGLLHPPAADEQAHAWDYDVVVKEVRRLAGERRYNLQETLIHTIYERLAAAKGVNALRIRSVKPDVYPDARGVGVEIASFDGPTP
ncbi:dihydroneopterin aldolase [Sphingomonas rhizophila]|uniref:dihydroneopterin aldolase n=1 Tax=Sphingomonas rhizophila TaxID=2071607 RepID=A0A7G9SCJ6_9SPHN|nr:dihydroneopterin aldolase [Sphingomonas rhizophila]QNN65571.1 dihydroneopterin aldolase [Sphingomonas rhizophila]